MKKRHSEHFIKLLLSFLLILLISGFPQFSTAAPNENDLLFVLTPKLKGTPPYTGFGPIDQAKIYIYKSGDAHAKNTGSIDQKRGIATQKGEWKYIFEGDYNSSSKELSGTILISLKTTDWNSDGTEYSSIRDDFNGKLNAKMTGDSTFEGQVTGTENLMQTFPESNALTEKSSKNHTWSFIANTAAEPAQADEESDDESNADDQISDPGKEIKKKYGDSGARVSGVTGQVEIHYPGDPEDEWHLIKLDTVIPPLARIKTDEDSSIIIGFTDMSTFVMKPETQIIVTTPPEKDSKLKLVAGNIWANVKKLIKDGSMEVEMNQAVAGIKGTTFILEETGSSS